MIPKPHILSIHPTMACDYHCHGCYLKRDEEANREERSPHFFVDLIQEAARLGIKEIAVPANYVKPDPYKIDTNLFYYWLFKELTALLKMEFTCTANYDFLKSHIDVHGLLLENVSLMSVSINDYSTSTKENKQEALDMLVRIKEKVPTVNCNVLLSPNMVKQLNDGLMDELLKRIDTVYLLVQKPIIVPMDRIKEWISGLEKFLDMIDERIILDSCLKCAFGLTDGICSKHQMIYVNPYGDVKHCSYDGTTMFHLDRPEDFRTLFSEKYPQDRLTDCKLLHYDKGN